MVPWIVLLCTTMLYVVVGTSWLPTTQRRSVRFLSQRSKLYQSLGSADAISNLNGCEPCTTGTTKQADDPTFLVDPTSDPTLEELSNQNLIKIVNLETSDEQCNALCWKCLGYRYQPDHGVYNNEKVFPKWRQSFPEPPDVIGVSRNYDPSVDRPVRDASMALMRSIPRDFKGGVRNLEADGFRGFKLNELTPNKTRRAQVVNWLIYYRERLFGKTLEDLQREREAERARQLEQQQQPPQEESTELPSERMFQRHRLDEVVGSPSQSTFP